MLEEAETENLEDLNLEGNEGTLETAPMCPADGSSGFYPIFKRSPSAPGTEKDRSGVSGVSAPGPSGVGYRRLLPVSKSKRRTFEGGAPTASRRGPHLRPVPLRGHSDTPQGVTTMDKTRLRQMLELIRLALEIGERAIRIITLLTPIATAVALHLL